MKPAKPEATMRAGWHVLVVLKQPLYGDMRCFVGEVQAVDVRGVRITLIDWFTGFFSGADMWFPWDGIAAIETYTDQHDLGGAQLDVKQNRYNGRKAEDK
jgi:hypothetical protein